MPPFHASSSKIDFSKFNFPREIWTFKPNAEIVCKLLLLLPIILCGVIGNLLLLNIIIRNRALHTPTNYILANMIAADTLTVIFCPIVFICSDFFQNFQLGHPGCKLDGFLQGFFVAAIVVVAVVFIFCMIVLLSNSFRSFDYSRLGVGTILFLYPYPCLSMSMFLFPLCFVCLLVGWLDALRKQKVKRTTQ